MEKESFISLGGTMFNSLSSRKNTSLAKIPVCLPVWKSVCLSLFLSTFPAAMCHQKEQCFIAQEKCTDLGLAEWGFPGEWLGDGGGSGEWGREGVMVWLPGKWSIHHLPPPLHHTTTPILNHTLSRLTPNGQIEIFKPCLYYKILLLLMAHSCFPFTVRRKF